MPKLPLDTTGRTWTYGVEHELADWDTRKGLPEGFSLDPEPNIMNSNGVAGDPTLKDYPFGAEINTPPTATAEGQAELLAQFLQRYPRSVASHRVGMHVHIRVPGLRNNLMLLNKLQRFISGNRELIQAIDPVNYPTGFAGDDNKLSREWVSYIRRSHWTVIPLYRVERQAKAKTLEEFLALEVPQSRTGKPLYHAQPRACVNLRQLLQTDTIEFRPFFQTLNPDIVYNAIQWCRAYLLTALGEGKAEDVPKPSAIKPMPTIPKFVPWMERRWRATSFSKLKRLEITINRRRILDGEFDDVDNSSFKHLEHL